MSAANTKSQAITNRDAMPMVLTPAHLVRGPLYEAVGTVEKQEGDADGSVYRIARLRSSDRLSQITLFNDPIHGAHAVDVGLYAPTSDGGAPVDTSLFASDLSLSMSSEDGGDDLTFEADIERIDQIERRLWERLGLAADPQREYDLCLTVRKAGNGAGTICLRVRYCAGN